MSIENAIKAAEYITDPLEYVRAYSGIARHVDETRSAVARQKCIAAAMACARGVKHREIAEACDVSPGMVQQWVKRGREFMRLDDPF